MKRVVKIIFSMALIILLYRKIDVSSFSEYFFTYHVFAIFIGGLIINNINVIVSSAKLSAIVSYITKKIESILLFTRIYYASIFLGLVFPSSIGGDIPKAYFIKKLFGKLTKTEVVSTIFLERITGIIAVLLLVIISLFVVDVRILYYDVISLFSFSLNTGYVIVLLCLGIGGLFVWKFRKKIPFEYIGKVITMPKVIFLSLLFQGIMILNNYLVFSFITDAGTLYHFLVFTPIVLFASMLPISIQGIGVRDSLALLLFGIRIPEVAAEKILTYTMVMNLIVVITSLIGGIVYNFSSLSKNIYGKEEGKHSKKSR